MQDAHELAFKDAIEVLKEEPENFIATSIKARCLYLTGAFEQCLLVWHKAKKIQIKSNQEKVSILYQDLMLIKRCIEYYLGPSDYRIC